MILKITDIFLKQKKRLMFETLHGDIDSVDYEDLDHYDNNYDFADDDDEYQKIRSIRPLFKRFDRDYYKRIINDDGFAGIDNNYREYVSKGDRYENLSPEEYINMIRPYLRDLINEHKPIVASNNNDNNNNNKSSYISTRSFEETRIIYTKSEPVEIYMGSDTENVIDTLFNTLLQIFQQVQETSNERGSEFIPDSVELLYYHFQKIDIRRAES